MKHITDTPQATLFTVDNNKLKEQAKAYASEGASHLTNAYGPSIDAYLESTHTSFYLQLIRTSELNEYVLFYCFKAGLYAQSYKHEQPTKLLPFQISELTYLDIYKEINIDALNFSLKEMNFE